MKDLLLDARFQILRFLGLSGLFGLLLLTLAALVGYVLIPQANEQRAALYQELSSAKDSASQASENRRDAPNSSAQLQSFLSWLPPISTNAKDVQRLFVLAKEGNIELTKADYQLTAEPGVPFVRYQMSVPVKGDYLAVRRFATGALNALPHLALDELQFDRPQATNGAVDAQLRFTLFYRSQ